MRLRVRRSRAGDSSGDGTVGPLQEDRQAYGHAGQHRVYDLEADLVVGEREHVIAMPRWRSDMRHPVDVIEDIAIGYGYDNMPRILSKVHMDAIPLKSSDLHRRARHGAGDFRHLALSR